MDLSKFKNLKSPYILILIGTPLSGKSFFYRKFISEVDSNVELISRDEIVMEVHGSRNYTESFNNVDQKEVDRVLNQKFLDANLTKKNVIVDMTHMSSKRRKKNLNYFSNDYYKLGVIFPILSDDEYERRNQKRIEEENKDIPMRIVKSMISSYQPITLDEGFNKLITIK
jgi:tRNA uridine 5-carbamoylmethylation protein Kti12